MIYVYKWRTEFEFVLQSLDLPYIERAQLVAQFSAVKLIGVYSYLEFLKTRHKSNGTNLTNAPRSLSPIYEI